MSSVRFRFATDILKRLGEELNPNPDQGIIELIKNAYDADAVTCVVELQHTDEEGGTLRVTDDGDGMDDGEIEKGWLVLGRTEKSPRKTTRLGRIPAGSKGLGRLAALRLGETVLLRTRPRKDERAEYELRINWKDFEEVGLVDQVLLTIERRNRGPAAKNGSEIIVEGLKPKIARAEVKRLARAMVLLADPFADNPTGFKPLLVAPEFSDLEEMVKNKYFRDAEFHLVASVDAEGRGVASVVDFRGKTLFSAKHSDLSRSRGGRTYRCPHASFDFWAFILTAESFSSRTATLPAVREWLQEFGGVHIYHNGLRVSPYGNPGDDWLEMNLRRVQSPEERPGTNTSIGRIVVTDPEAILQQKTDRSGFIENEAFLELKSLAQDTLEWMARERLRAAELRRAKQRAAAPKKAYRTKIRVEEVIKVAPKRVRPRLTQAFRAYDRARDKEVDRLRKEVQLYRSLSTVGIVAATFAHEASGNPVKTITQSAQAIERRARDLLGDQYDSSLRSPVDGIMRTVKSLGVLTTATLDLLDNEKRRFSRVDVHAVIGGLLETFRPFLDGRGIKVKPVLYPGTPYMRASEAAIESVLTNLVTNSVAAFERSMQSERLIEIRTSIDGNMVTLRVLDNGPGIVGIKKADIWSPGQTTKKNGTGLGLTIVRDTVLDLGGEVDAIEHCELGGAEIIIRLPILGA